MVRIVFNCGIAALAQ